MARAPRRRRKRASRTNKRRFVQRPIARVNVRKTQHGTLWITVMYRDGSQVLRRAPFGYLWVPEGDVPQSLWAQMRQEFRF